MTDPIAGNPFAVLTFIVAPAILTNAASVMALSTSNRFARAVDRARTLAKELGESTRGEDEVVRIRARQLNFANRRARLLVRALTAFYLSMGAFAAASLTSLLGAALVVAHLDAARPVALVLALGCGALGVGGLVGGSVLLVWETRLTLAIIREESELVARRLHLDPQTVSGGGTATPGEAHPHPAP